MLFRLSLTIAKLSKRLARIFIMQTEFYEKIIRGDVSPENLTELVTDFKKLT